ncbi:ABC transporter substrate-binding protein [Paenibacillus sp. NPDC056579]|uniref:ABC transporter substrate-binding protein n=1 Tax=unclassified Paenibacillus TaxID=185978 RepID=UPI001EF96909|nr:extracellular solute-binding protein [Paenibacillus sp. H1-7]ULL19285.1 extracellular solute-binding protein [Paenibacillus sp. H1-7]
MLKKSAILLAAISLSASALAACGNNSQSGKGDAAGPGTSKEPVELSVYNNAGITEEQFKEKFGNYIAEKLPHVTIKFIPKDKSVSLTEMVSSGSTKIDIYMDSIGQIGLKSSLLDLGLQYDMSDLVKKHNVDLSRFEPTTIDAIKLMGGLYGLPISNSTMVMYYNKDLFDKFGVPYPKDGMTWEEVTELSKKMTRSESGVQYVGYSTSIVHYLRMNPLSLVNVDPKSLKANFESDQWRQLVQTTLVDPMSGSGYKDKVKELEKKWYKVPYVDEFSKNKDTAMFSYIYADSAWLKDVNWDVVSMPALKEKPKVGAQSYPSYMFITSTSEKKDAAMEVIKLFISDEYQTSFSKSGGITSLKNEEIKKVFGQDTPDKTKNIKNAVFYNQFAPATPKTPFDTHVEADVRAQIPKLIMGDTDINTALRTAQEAVNKKIETESVK